MHLFLILTTLAVRTAAALQQCRHRSSPPYSPSPIYSAPPGNPPNSIPPTDPFASYGTSICYTSMSTSIIPRASSTSTTTHFNSCPSTTSTATSIVTSTVTTAPPSTTTTITATTTTTSTAPASFSTSTVTQTSTVTVSTTITSSTSTTSTSTSTIFRISTIPTPVGFLAVQNTLPLAGYDGYYGTSPANAQKRHVADTSSSIFHFPGEASSPNTFPQGVTCHQWIQPVNCSVYSAIITSTTITIVQGTSTGTITSTILSTVTATYVPHANTTTSTTSTITSTNTATTVVTSTVTSYTTSVYAACATNNFADIYNGFLTDGVNATVAPGYIGPYTASATTPYGCCVAVLLYSPTAELWSLTYRDPANQANPVCTIPAGNSCGAVRSTDQWQLNYFGTGFTAIVAGNSVCGS